MMRHNPHWHCIILEGGIDEQGSFHHIPIKDTFQLTEVVELLIEKGVDVNAVSSHGNIALMIALDGGHTEIVKLLREAGAE